MPPARPRRWYRVLLALYPPSVREERGPEMECLFEAMCRDRIEEKGALGVGFRAAAVWDALGGALVEWLSAARDVIRSVTAKTMGEHMFALWGDVRFAARQLVQQPMYSLTIVFLMAVGIAGNAAVFRIVNGLFIRPLPFEESERLVDLNETAPQWDLEILGIAYRDFDRWRAESRTFEAMTIVDFDGGNAMIDGSPLHLDYLRTTHDADDVFRMEPLLGRFFEPQEDQPDGPGVGLLTYAFWQQQFASDRDVLGRTVSIAGRPVEIIGVLPPESRFVGESDMWIPLQEDPTEFDGWSAGGVGRLAAGVTIEQAREELLAIHKGMVDEFEVNEISFPTVTTLRDRFLGDYRLGSGFLMAAVAVVLLIVCVNIAGLVSARSMGRSQEVAVRRALGAPRGRIVRQLLTESAVLATVGAAAGLLLGAWGSGAILSRLAEEFPRWVTFDLDARFMTFAVGITVAAAVLFGLAPALQASGRALAGTSRTTGSLRRRRVMSMMVSGEVALALTLLVVGGLTVLDARRLADVDPGFEADGLIGYSLSLPEGRYDSQARLAFVDDYLPRLAALPGIESAAVASSLPLSGHWGWFFIAEGAPPRGEEDSNPVVLNRVVSPSYFETAGVEFVAGGPFDDFHGRDRGTRAVVVNETFVRTHLSHVENPIGARVVSGTDLPDDPSWMTVVGVTRDVKHYGVDEEMRPGVYQPIRQFALAGFQVALRVRGESSAILSQVRALTTEIDAELPVFDVVTMNEEMDEALWARRASSWLIAAFSAVALLLAVAGLYGMISYTVGQRTREISIRMAVGAQREDVLRQVVRQGMVLVAFGTVLGLGLSLAGARLVSGLLVGVEPRDPVVYGGVTLLVLVVAATANYLPARRAARLDPMEALRRE
jgi:predicted permease